MPALEAVDHDAQVRLAAFAFLDEQRISTGGDLPWHVLMNDFHVAGERVPLLGPQGIFKPKILVQPIPLSIATAPVRPGKPRPYEDEQRSDGLFTYRYRGLDPNHRENVGLRLAMRDQVPLIYFVGIAKGWYTAAYPAYVVEDDPATLSVTIAVDEKAAALKPEARVAEGVAGIRRAYATQLTRRRMHQDAFRHNVLAAYDQSCAVCRLKQRPLLQAAHIIADRDPRGVPEVFNGLSLCGLHHGAFDSHIMGIRPAADLIVEVREDVLRAKDGPMLIYGIQECHGKPLAVVPNRDSLKPRREYLEERYELFRKAI